MQMVPNSTRKINSTELSLDMSILGEDVKAAGRLMMSSGLEGKCED